MDKYAVWVKAKPEFDRECTFVTAHLIKDVWDFSSWRIIKVDSEDGWYWALCNIDGEEWGPLEDLSAQLYYVLPNPGESPVDRGVEKAAMDYSDKEAWMAVQLEVEQAFIAGAKWAGNDAVEFAEWIEKGKWWADQESINELVQWSNDSANPQYLTTEQLYNLFKQKQL